MLAGLLWMACAGRGKAEGLQELLSSGAKLYRTDPRGAVLEWDKAAEKVRKAGDKAALRTVLALTGKARLGLDDDDDAGRDFLEGYSLLPQNPDPSDQSFFALGIAEAYIGVYRFSAAVAYLDEAVRAQKKVGNTAALAAMLTRQGYVYYRLKDWDKAARAYSEARDLQPAGGDPVERQGLVSILKDLDKKRSGKEPPEPAPLRIAETPEGKLPAEFNVQSGHGGGSPGLAQTPDGRFLLTRNGDELKLWTKDGRLVWTMDIPGGTVNDLAVGPDGNWFATASGDGYVRIWGLDKKLVRELNHAPEEPERIAVSPDGRYLFTAASQSIRVEDERYPLGPMRSYRSRRINSIRKWATNGELLTTVEQQEDIVNDLAVSQDGRRLATAHGEHSDHVLLRGGRIKVWDAGTMENLVKVDAGDTPISFVGIASDGRIAAVANGGGGKVGLWSLEGKPLAGFVPHAGGLASVRIHQDGARIITSGVDRHITWTEEVKGVKFAHEKNEGASVRVWDAGGRKISDIPLPLPGVRDAIVDPRGDFVYTFNSGHEIRERSPKIWTVDGHLFKDLGQINNAVNPVHLSESGRYVVFEIGHGGDVMVWRDGRPFRTIRHSSSSVGGVQLSIDEKYIATDDEKDRKIWSLEDGRLLEVLPPDSFYEAQEFVFVPGGRYARRMSEGIEVREIGGPRVALVPRDKMAGPNKGPTTWSMAASRDGRHVITCFGDRQIRFWDMKGGLAKSFPFERSAASYDASHDLPIFVSVVWTSLRGPNDPDYSSAQRMVQDAEGNLVVQSGMGAVEVLDGEGERLAVFKGPDKGAAKEKVLINTAGNRFSIMIDKTLYIMDRARRILHTSQEDFGLYSADVDAAGKFLVTGHEAGMAKLTNLQSKKSARILGTEKDWIIYTDDGYFDASRNAGALVGITRGLRNFAVDQFAAFLNRPDIIYDGLQLGGGTQVEYFRALHEKRLRRMGLSGGGAVDFHAPEARILEHRTEDKTVVLRASFSDKKYPLKKYNIYVNDVPVYGGDGKDLQGREAVVEERVELGRGMNRIEVSCFNGKGTESFRDVVNVVYAGPAPEARYFIGFGVSRYADESINLKYAAKDAEDLARIFSKMKPRFKEVKTMVLTDEEVTGENIGKAKSFLAGAGVDDTVVLFIAGHGMHGAGRDAPYYFLTHGTNLGDLPGTAARFEAIEDILQGIRPRKKLFLMDTCESGELGEDTEKRFYAMAGSRGLAARTIKRGLRVTSEKSSAGAPRAFLFERDRFIHNDLLRRSGAIIFSSSRGGEFSYESDEYRNGLFTAQILRALAAGGADGDKDGVISTDELRDFVGRSVPELALGQQHPTVDRDNLYLKFDFPVER